MEEQRVQALGDKFGPMVENETGVSLGLNFGLAKAALHDAIYANPNASDEEILQQAMENLRNPAADVEQVTT